MSIVIALIVVFLVAGLIVNFYPKPTKPTLAEGEILIPDPIEENTIEPVVESIPEGIVESPVVKIPVVEIPKMVAKPKKKPQPKKKPATKVNA
jgi:outer membrane biosynthesis protein TonB